ncbi:MAG: NAD(P)/FAD-dependent oxidoreductase [Peptococcaceae bacterium]|nr:NAD(P)/FAD-dependent oxidoreductase [Peptococcaceae bacterium]
MKPTYKEKYPHLFEPMYVGKNKVRFNNRACMAPIGSIATGGGEMSEGRISQNGIDQCMNYIRGGFSTVALPMEVPIDGGHEHMFNLNPKTCNQMQFHLLQRSVHAYRGLTFAELLHCGPFVNLPDYPRLGADTYVTNGYPVKAATLEDMKGICDLFAQYALWAKIARFDGLMIHMAHGWLFNQFLSPLTNHRTDEFGGSVENRCRFPMMVLKAIRDAVGDDLLIELRLNGNDEVEGGILPEDAAQQVLILQEYADMIHITCGHRVDALSRPKQHPSNFFPMAHNAYASEIVKNTPGVHIPIGVVGAIYTPEVAEEVLAKGQADYVLMARSAMADPEIIKKAKEGREDDIRPCLRCNYCMDHGRREALTTELHLLSHPSYDRHCATNPLAFQSLSKRDFPPAERVKRIAVVGGGVAGMEAALAAAERGHEVIIYEKTDKLGGQALLSDVMWFKKEMKLFHEYLERQVRKRQNIIVNLNTECTPEIIDDLDPDAVIVAVGAEQIVPNIPGVEKAVMSFDVFGHEEENVKGKKVAIIGGGDIGVELGIYLNELGHECTIVEMGHYIAPKAQLTERISYLEWLEQEKVQTMVDTKCVEITDKGAVIEDADGNQKLLEADTVIIAVGTKSLAEERDKFIDTAFDVINVGDCVKASSIVHAVHTGFDAGWTL